MGNFDLLRSLSQVWDNMDREERTAMLIRACQLDDIDAGTLSILRLRQLQPYRQYALLSAMAFGFATDFTGVE